MEMALPSCENSGLDVCLNRNLSVLEYAGDVVLLDEDPSCKLFSIET